MKAMFKAILVSFFVSLVAFGGYYCYQEHLQTTEVILRQHEVIQKAQLAMDKQQEMLEKQDAVIQKQALEVANLQEEVLKKQAENITLQSEKQQVEAQKLALQKKLEKEATLSYQLKDTVKDAATAVKNVVVATNDRLVILRDELIHKFHGNGQ